MGIAIKVENLSKAYQLGVIGTGTLSKDIERWAAKMRGKEDPFLKIGENNERATGTSSGSVWSLKDINFEIEQGDALGIIGRNGAGKSTLLKILSRITSPTTGKIMGKGRIASLLEVGTGFHPELTGRENIFLNGAILGMRKKEIERKLAQIVDFSGVEQYIDTPVKRYSSGMYVRLAFAVAAHLEPEILIVDEVLAVGDAEFQKKCIGKMKDVSDKEGRTVLFVSHNMSAVANLCNKGLLLNNGTVDFDGTAQDAVKYYMQKSIVNEFHYISENTALTDKIKEVKMLRDNKQENESFIFGETIKVKIGVEHRSKVPGTHIGMAILDKWHQKIFTDTVKLTEQQLTLRESEFIAEVPARILLAGVYYIDVALFVPRLNNFDYVPEACTFEIEDLNSELAIYNGAEIGSVMVKCRWQIVNG